MITPALSVHCNTLEEARAAMAAIAAFRKDSHPRPTSSDDPTSSDEPPDPTDALARRIEAALAGSQPNRAREIMLRTLLETPPGVWLPYADMEAALANDGLDPQKARAALGYFSWQMREYMPPEDLAGLTKDIEVLAERLRADGVHKYRLTTAGRIAVERFLGQSHDRGDK